MKKIGYIYRYNEDERKGILVYGYNWDSNYNPTKPIKFSNSDCISDVHTGQLVYFELEGSSSASHIERASLANFKKEVVLEIVSCYGTKSIHDCYRNTRIRFENVEDNSLDDFFNDLEDYLYELDGLPYKERQEKKLPSNIDELFDVFGTKGHHTSFGHDNSSTLIDILNIEQWIDKDIVQREQYYGITAEEVLDLFELFVNKRRIANREHQVQNVNSSKEVDDSISPSWKLLLVSLSKDDLRTICKKEPMLQPALPSEFCLDNLDVLSINYGFPDLTVCEEYYRYRIRTVKLTAEYQFMSNKIHYATHCTVKHKENEGVPACRMEKNVLKELKDLLEKQYHTVVLEDVKQKLSFLSDNTIKGERRVSLLLKEGNIEYLANLGHFVDIYEYNCVLRKAGNDTICYNCDYYDTISIALFVYNDLVEEDKFCLDLAIRSKFKECVMGIAKERYNDRKVYQLCSLINNYPQYLTSEDFEAIKEIVNFEFAKLDDLGELDDSASCGLITEKQNLDRYKELTADYDIESILGILKNHFNHKNMPTSTQAYLIKQVFDKYKFKTLNSYHYVKVDYDTICNFCDLVGWFNKECKYGYLNAQIFGDILKEITEGFSREDRWQLFDKGLVSSPGMDNIREYLDDAYNRNRFENEYFRKDCFQDVMCTDLLAANGNKLKFMIAEHLDQKHQRDLQDKCDGVIELYLRIINPNEKYDWNLITSYLSELPVEKQIRLFRYIFYLIAKKSIVFSIDELYQLFVESEKKACQAVSGIIYLLKEQFASMGKIKSEKLDEIIGKGINNTQEFLLAKTFFYPCGGHLALTQTSQDREYHTYNGYVDKIFVQEKEYYSICFYDIPHDVCDTEVDWLDDKYIQIAKAVLETNIKTKIIDGNYMVDNSEEIALKQFVMSYGIDDRCCLLDSKQALIEKGYLRPNNSYQPLYTNYIRPYDDNSFDVCRCTNYIDVDPIVGIPFYWCNKRPCVRRCHYILPLSEWEKYKLSDFIYILLGCETVNLSKVWNMTSEISQFFNAYIESKRSKNESNELSAKEQFNTQNLQINQSDEIGVLTEELSIVQDICDDD